MHISTILGMQEIPDLADMNESERCARLEETKAIIHAPVTLK